MRADWKSHFHNLCCGIWLLERMRHHWITEELIHPLQCLAFGLRVEDHVAYNCNDVEGEEHVEVLEPDIPKSDR